MQRVNNIQCENLCKLLALSLGLTLVTAMYKVTMYHIAGNLAGINFGDFSQTPYSLIIIIWRILNLAIWSLDQNDVTSTPARAGVGPC